MYAEITSAKIISNLKNVSDPVRAKNLARFFKTGKGQYGEGDIFAGITVPEIRKISQKYQSLDSEDLEKLIKHKIHEYRLCGLLILVGQYAKANNTEQKKIYEYYLTLAKYINNWDLVDLTAPKIPGKYLLNNPKKRKILYQLAKSNDLWERRIAILSTFTFIRDNDFEDALKISELLLKDNHDLIHKAVGWMLREIGKKEQQPLINFLEKNYHKMPRTMLRYAIERLPEQKRLYWLKKK